MSRALRPGRGWEVTRRHFAPAGSPAAADVARVIRKLMEAPTLPEPQDGECLVSPTQHAWYRRVASLNLWVLYRAGERELFLVALKNEPPLPIQ